MDKPPDRYVDRLVRLRYDSPAGGRPYRIYGPKGGPGFYLLVSATEIRFNGVLNYAQGFSTIAHFSEFDFLN